MGKWLLPHQTQWVMLALGRWAKHSSAAEAVFSVSLLVISKDQWDAENIPAGRRAARPTVSWEPHGWNADLHGIARDHGGDVPDHWTVRPDSDLAALARDVLDAIKAYALPEIERQLSMIDVEAHLCWHNVGGRNWFEPCRRPADVTLRTRSRTTYRCADHANAARAALSAE